jgi:hypothetical protein
MKTASSPGSIESASNATKTASAPASARSIAPSPVWMPLAAMNSN